MCTKKTPIYPNGTLVRWPRTSYTEAGEGTIVHFTSTPRLEGHNGYYDITGPIKYGQCAAWACDVDLTTQSTHDLW